MAITADPPRGAPEAAIRIICKEEKGFGDIMFCYKVYKTFIDYLPRCVEVSISPGSAKEERKLQILCPDIPLMPIAEVIRRIEQLPTLVIDGPVAFGGLPISKSRSIDIWHIGEYSRYDIPTSSKNQKYVVSGPGEGELGIFMEEDLYQEGRVLYQAHKSSDPTRLHFLKNLQLRDLLKDSGSKLYFGYASRGGANIRIQFVEDIFRREITHPSNIDICIIWPYCISIDGFVEAIEDLCKVFNLSVEFWRPPSSEDPSLSLEKSYMIGPRKVRIFIPESLDHADFQSLLRASDPYTLITGDESLSEALALGKIILYEVLPHKKRLASNLIQLSQRMGLKKVEQLLTRKDTEISGYKEPLNKEFLDDPDLKKEIRVLVDFLYEERNLAKNLIKQAQVWLSNSKANPWDMCTIV